MSAKLCFQLQLQHFPTSVTAFSTSVTAVFNISYSSFQRHFSTSVTAFSNVTNSSFLRQLQHFFNISYSIFQHQLQHFSTSVTKKPCWNYHKHRNPSTDLSLMLIMCRQGSRSSMCQNNSHTLVFVNLPFYQQSQILQLK